MGTPVISRYQFAFRRIISLVTKCEFLKCVHRSLFLSSSRILFAAVGPTSIAFTFLGGSKKEEKSRSPADVRNLDLIIRETDILYANYMIDNAYNILYRHINGKCSELLWRLARVLCEKGKLSKDKNERKRLMYEALDVIQKALENEAETGCFGAHKWYAIILNYISEYEGSKERLRKCYEVRRHLEKALDIDGSDATTWHILGVWHFTFADMSSYTRLIASALFESPPSSSYEEALKYFEKAEYISPDFYSSNTWYLAEVKDRLGQKDEAKALFLKAFRMPVVTADDQEIHVKAHQKLRKLGVKDKDLL